MAVVKYDTMINLMPDLWLTKMQEGLDEDDIVEYGRLVIDIPDTPDIADVTTEEQTEPNTDGYSNTELRGDQPDTEKKTSSSTQNTTKPTESKPQKVLPLRRNRDFPIKLLLKRSFQNSSNKPHKKRMKDYSTDSEREKLNKYNNNIDKNILPTLEHNQNQLKTQERIDTKNILANDINQRVSPLNLTNNTTRVSSEEPDSLNQSMESHREEFLSTLMHYTNQVQEQNVNRTCTIPEEVNNRASQDYVKNNSVYPEKQNTRIGPHKNSKEKEPLLLYKNKSNQSETKDDFDQRTYLNHIKKAKSLANSRKQNILNYSVNNHKKEINTSKDYSNDVEPETIVKAHTVADNVNSRDYLGNSMKNTTNVSPERQNTLNKTIQNQEEDLSKWNTHKYYSNPIQVETLKSTEGTHTVNDEQRISPPNNKENNEKNTNFDPLHSRTLSQSYQTPREDRQRISVVSNEFLFRHRSKREALGRTGTNSRFHTNNDQRNCPQLYQESLIDFMGQQYQLALRENIPLSVNTKFLHPEPLKEIPDTRLTEVIHVDQRTSPQDFIQNTPPRKQKSPNVANQNHSQTNQNITKNTQIAEQNSLNSDNQSGYNILVHRGPGVNRIVITIANESEEKNDTIHQSFNGDQRVPESTINTSYSEASSPSQKKRSYYYKEPSLRSFRRRLPHQCAQKQIRNTIKQNRFDPSDPLIDNHKNVALAHHYSYIGNHYEFPTPVIENYYTLDAQNYSMPAFVPWELNDRRPTASERITRRSIKSNMQSSQKQSNLNPHKQQILFGPLNLSLKPLAVNERPCPELCPKCPMSVQGYY